MLQASASSTQLPRLPTARRGILGLAVLILLASACADPDPVRIGLAGPLSDPVGAPMRRAVQLAVEELNASGGIRGRRIQLVEFDDHGDPDSAVAVAGTLRASDVVAVIGHVWSSTTMAAGPVYGAGLDPVPVISPSSSAPGASAGAHVFRVCPTDDAHGTALAQFALRGLRVTRAAMLYRNDEYGRGIQRTFATTFERLGGVIAGTHPYLDPGNDVGPFLELLARDRQAQVLLVAGDRQDALAILREAHARGLTLPVIGGDGLEGIEGDGPLAEGVHVSTAWLPDGGSPQARTFLAAYQARYPDAGPPNQPAAAAWDVAHLLGSLLRDVGPDRARLIEAIGTVGQSRPEFDGATGPIGFTSEGDLARGEIAISVVRAGKLVRAVTR